MFTIEHISTLSNSDLVNIFGNVVEKYPDIVPNVFSNVKFKTIDSLCEAFAHNLEILDLSEKLKILKLHPVLVGGTADKNLLTQESVQEQKAAGLQNLNQDNKNEFNLLNNRYLEKFGFPFVICARENKAGTMIEQIQKRLENDINTEINNGINEVKKISKLRILDIVKK